MANFGMVDARLPKNQGFGKVANAPVELVHIENEHYSYLPGAHASEHDSSFTAGRYMPTSSRLEQILEHEDVKEKDKRTIEMERREDV